MTTEKGIKLVITATLPFFLAGILTSCRTDLLDETETLEISKESFGEIEGKLVDLYTLQILAG